jgi:hypothetical protein
VRLVMAEVPGSVWVWLEADTPEEMSGLESCAARGEWTNGAPPCRLTHGRSRPRGAAGPVCSPAPGEGAGPPAPTAGCPCCSRRCRAMVPAATEGAGMTGGGQGGRGNGAEKRA